MGLLQDSYNIDNLDGLTESIEAVHRQIRTLSPNFLLELYALLRWDESFFHEYISEFMSTGWQFSEQFEGAVQVGPLYEYVKGEDESEVESQQLFTFLKTLILYGIDLKLWMVEPMVDKVSPVYLALLADASPEKWMPCDIGGTHNYRHMIREPEVVPLKDLCRRSVRQYYFGNKRLSAYDALKALYSLNAPSQIRHFLCYNGGTWKF